MYCDIWLWSGLINSTQRDQETHTSLSATLTNLRTTTSTQTTQLARLQTSNAALRRDIDISRSETRAAQSALHAAEGAARVLREELAKAKTTLVQIRAQCANEVRKRDMQMQKLKGHLSSAQRGTNGRVVPASCTIVGNNGSSVLSAAPRAAGTAGSSARQESAPSLDDAEYSLKQETTEFLTQLSQSMSDENDALIGMVKGTLSTLRGLMELPPGPTGPPDVDKAEDGEEMVVIVPVSYNVLSADLEFVLRKLQALLTRDDFAPISEVYARDEEIMRLREGWEKMESRWREAVDLMKGWQQRMQSGGGTVNLKELNIGLNLGEGLDTVDRGRTTGQDPSDADSEADELPENDRPFSGSDSPRKNQVLDDLDLESSPPASPPISTALRERSGNLVESPSTATARARKLHAEQRQQQENDRQSTQSSSSERAGELSKKPKVVAKQSTLKVNGKHHKTPSTSTQTSGTASPPSRQAPSSRTAHTAKSGGSAKVKSSTGTLNNKAPSTHRSPLHKHINTLLASSSSPTSSPEQQQKAKARAPTLRSRPSTKQLVPGAGPRERAQARQGNTYLPPSLATNSASSPSKQHRHQQKLRATKSHSQMRRAPSAVPILTVSQKLELAEAEARRASLNPQPAPALDESDEDEDAEYDEARIEEDASVPASHDDQANARGDVETQGLADGVSNITLDPSAEAGTEDPESSFTLPKAAPKPKTVVIRSPARPATRSVKPSGWLARGTGRRKRKSTLSPEELEELMGLRSSPSAV